MRALTQIVIKTLITTTAIAALLAVAGRSLAPAMPLAQWLMVCGLALAALFALMLVVTVVGLTIRQWVLRLGGTDVQWLAFPRDPPGLQRPPK